MPIDKNRASLTYNTAKWAAELEYDQLPQHIVQAAKYCFLDTVGVALAGSKTQSVLKVNEYVADNSGR